MPHPYRTPAPPEPRSSSVQDEGCPDADIALVLFLTLAASMSHVVWACANDELDLEYGLAVGTALLCLALLRPFFGWLAGRIWRAVTRLGRD